MTPPRLVAWSWTVAVLILCWLPGRHLPIPEDQSFGYKLPQKDKFVHATMFGLFGALWVRAVGPDRRLQKRILVAGALLAGLTEAVQGLPFIGRDPDVFDSSADLVGLVLGMLAGRRWLVARERPPDPA